MIGSRWSSSTHSWHDHWLRHGTLDLAEPSVAGCRPMRSTGLILPHAQTARCNRRSAFTLTPYRASDKTRMFDLLKVVDARYPGGFRWLDQRLDDVWRGTAGCTVVRTRRELVGAAIQSPKGSGRLKLSTLWIAPMYRGRGAGALLLDKLVAHWRRAELSEVWVTTDLRHHDDLWPSIRKAGFEPMLVVRARYGPERHEVVYRWTQD